MIEFKFAPPVTLTVLQVAHHLSVSRSKVYRMLDAGEIPSFRVGRLRRVLVPDLGDYIRNRRKDDNPRGPRPDGAR